MTQTYQVSGFPAPATTDFMDVYATRLFNGVETVRTLYAGSSDPSVGAPVTWGAADVGVLWLDTTDPANPKLKLWQQLSATPTYGWRTLRILKTKYLSTPQAITFSPASPAGADVAFTDVSLATLLNGAGAQDAGQTVPVVRAVQLRIRVRTGALETIPAGDNCYFAVREKGSTNEQRVYPQVANRYVESQVWIGLDSSEVFQFAVDVGGGTPAFEYEAWVCAIAEEF